MNSDAPPCKTKIINPAALTWKTFIMIQNIPLLEKAMNSDARSWKTNVINLRALKRKTHTDVEKKRNNY